jgi:hypothetical protein
LFTQYALLGDDLVLGDQGVKDKYLIIMSELGVPINQSKSILSTRGSSLEFAKRTFVRCGGDLLDCSPIPIKELEVTFNSMPEFILFVKKYKMELPTILNFLNIGYKTRARIKTSDFTRYPSFLRNLIISMIATGDLTHDHLTLGFNTPLEK